MKKYLGKNIVLLMICVTACNAAAANRSNVSRKPSSSYDVHVEAGWNLLSVHLDVVDGTKGVLYPTAPSPAYTYQDSYVAQETLQSGPGY